MKQMNPKTLAAAIAAGAVVAGIGVSVLMPRPAVKFSGTVEIDPKNSNPPVAVQPQTPPPAPPLNPAPPEALPPVQQVPPVEPIPIPEHSVKINKVQVTDKGIEVVPSDLPVKKTTRTAEENLQAAFGEMLNTKTAEKNSKSKTSSAIPPGTRLLGLKADKNGIRVDLSEEFSKSAGAASLQSRLAQVVYTATALDPRAKVWLSVNGEELKELGGLELDQPMTRTSLKKDFSSIQGAQ
jgi:Sporulation and spore germination